MKFVHTADWQIGMKADSVGNCAAKAREERFAAARRVIEVAKTENVDFILVAGDIFEDNAVDQKLVQKVADTLRSFEGPVLIIPGNHDPLVPGCVWDHPSWNAASNLRVIKEESPITIAEAVVYPCPLKAKHSTSNPTAWIQNDPDDKIRIGLAHGTVEGILQDEPDYPIPRNTPERAGLDYVALGHWHSFAPYSSADGSERMAYSGTHETTKFGERNSGNCLVVEIESRGKAPKIKPVRTGGLEWVTVPENLVKRGDIIRVKEYVESMKKPEMTLIQVRLSGILNMEDQAEVKHLQEILESRFFWSDLDISKLGAAPTDQTWIDDLGPGVIQETARRLLGSSGVEPEVTQLALSQLYTFVKGAAK